MTVDGWERPTAEGWHLPTVDGWNVMPVIPHPRDEMAAVPTSLRKSSRLLLWPKMEGKAPADVGQNSRQARAARAGTGKGLPMAK